MLQTLYLDDDSETETEDIVSTNSQHQSSSPPVDIPTVTPQMHRRLQEYQREHRYNQEMALMNQGKLALAAIMMQKGTTHLKLKQ